MTDATMQCMSDDIFATTTTQPEARTNDVVIEAYESASQSLAETTDLAVEAHESRAQATDVVIASSKRQESQIDEVNTLTGVDAEGGLEFGGSDKSFAEDSATGHLAADQSGSTARTATRQPIAEEELVERLARISKTPLGSVSESSSWKTTDDTMGPMYAARDREGEFLIPGILLGWITEDQRAFMKELDPGAPFGGRGMKMDFNFLTEKLTVHSNQKLASALIEKLREKRCQQFFSTRANIYKFKKREWMKFINEEESFYSLALQPILSLEEPRKLRAGEMLLRGYHSRENAIFEDIDMFEKAKDAAGLIELFNKREFKEARRFITEFDKKHIDIEYVSVNLYASSMLYTAPPEKSPKGQVETKGAFTNWTFFLDTVASDLEKQIAEKVLLELVEKDPITGDSPFENGNFLGALVPAIRENKFGSFYGLAVDDIDWTTFDTIAGHYVRDFDVFKIDPDITKDIFFKTHNPYEEFPHYDAIYAVANEKMEQDPNFVTELSQWATDHIIRPFDFTVRDFHKKQVKEPNDFLHLMTLFAQFLAHVSESGKKVIIEVSLDPKDTKTKWAVDILNMLVNHMRGKMRIHVGNDTENPTPYDLWSAESSRLGVQGGRTGAVAFNLNEVLGT